ncbi:MAG: discoidin domain-containing protein [Candidatus Omnitrophota bacterium]
MLGKVKKIKLWLLMVLFVFLLAGNGITICEAVDEQVPGDIDYFNNNYSAQWVEANQADEAFVPDNNIGWVVKNGKEQIVFGKDKEISEIEGKFYIIDAAKNDIASRVNGNFSRYKNNLLFTGDLKEFGLSFDAIFIPHDNFIEVMGRLKNNTKPDRAINITYSLDIDALGWDWWNNIREKRGIKDVEDVYSNATTVLVGQRGEMSVYPFSCISSGKQAFSYGVPLDRPRVFNIYYDTKIKKYNISFDFALTDKTEKFPNEADFYFIIYSPDARWGFRSAAKTYYDIYPEFFEKRTTREGIWMPFTAVNSVKDAEDFDFAFHEFNIIDLEYNNKHGIYSFRYLEPWTYWMALESSIPREHEEVFKILQGDTMSKDQFRKKMAQATILSGMYNADGEILHNFLNRPWCNGVVFFENTDPDIEKGDTLKYNRADISFNIAKKDVVERNVSVFESWDNYAEGYAIDENNVHSGSSSLKLARNEGDREFGAKQVITLNQTEARPLVFGGYSKALNVGGKKDADYSIYIDLLYSDDTSSWGHTIVFDTGTHDWQYKQNFIYPEKPIKMVMFYLLFRGNHTGEVWFDDTFCKELTDEEITKVGKQEWDKYNNGFEVSTDARTGQKAMFINKSEASGVYGARQKIDLNQKTADPIKISGWSKSEDVQGSVNSDYSLYADMTYADGTPVYGVVRNFDVGTHDWQSRELIFEPEKPIRTILLHLLFRGDRAGKVWFDDISIIDTVDGKEFVRDGSFEKTLIGTPQEIGNSTANLMKNSDFEKGSSGLIVDGIYLDSLEGWAKEENFRQEHFKYADIPLTYDVRTKEPVILNAFSIYEFTKAMSEYMRANNRFLMANWVTIDFPFYAPLLDVAGKEVGWLGWENAYQPDSDNVMSYRRTLSYQKPYLLLLNVDFSSFTFDMMDKYFQRSLFYGMFPSMFSIDAATNPYFENPNYYNRDRSLFIKYIPVLKKISKAGWQPVTFAKTNNENILIERYGKNYSEDLYFTVHNNLDFNQKGYICIDKKSLGVDGKVIITEVISNADINYDSKEDNFVFPVVLSSYQTMVFRVIKDDFAVLSKVAFEDLTDLSNILNKYERQNKITSLELSQYNEIIEVMEKEISDEQFMDNVENIEEELSDLTTLVEQKGQVELLGQILRVENSISKVLANVLKVSLDLKGLDNIVSPSRGKCVLTIYNDKEEPITTGEIYLTFSANLNIDNLNTFLGEEIPSQSSISRNIVFDIPPGLLEGTGGMVNVKLSYSSGTRKDTLLKAQLLDVVKDIDFKMEPVKVRTFNTKPEFKVLVHNNCNVPVKGTLRVTTADKCRSSLNEENIEIAAKETECVIFDVLCPKNDQRRDFNFNVSFIVDGEKKVSQDGVISVFPKTDSLLLVPGVSIKVDSSFPGYTTKPINDGIIDAKGFVWNESAWASAETTTPHWVEIKFLKPVSISSMVIHWAEDGDAYFTSNKYKIEYLKDGEWILLDKIEGDNAPKAYNKHTFRPVVTDKIRIWQDYSGGSKARSDLLWLREVEVFNK